MNIVIVVDMLRGFLKPGYPLYIGDDGRKIIPSVRELLRREQSKGSRIIYVGDCHEPDDPEFQMWSPHCVCGTEEAEVIPELAEFKGDYVPKTRYDAFYDSELDKLLQEQTVDQILICGVCTDICVMHTVAAARLRRYPVTVYADCVASFDLEHHRFALEHIERVLGARISTLAEEGQTASTVRQS